MGLDVVLVVVAQREPNLQPVAPVLEMEWVALGNPTFPLLER